MRRIARPRKAGDVSRPASAATVDRRAQKQALTAKPSTSTAMAGDASGLDLASDPAREVPLEQRLIVDAGHTAGCTDRLGELEGRPPATRPRSKAW